LAEYFKGWLVSAEYKPFSFFYFDNVTIVPRKFFGEIEVVLDVFCVNIFVVQNVIEHPTVKNASITPNLVINICSVLELDAAVKPTRQCFGHKYVCDSHLLALRIAGLDNEFAAAGQQE